MGSGPEPSAELMGALSKGIQENGPWMVAQGGALKGLMTVVPGLKAEEQPRPEVAAVAAALQVTAGAGGPGASALEGLAAGIRDRVDAAAEVAALSAQARLSAIVVGSAPLASLALSLLADRRVAPTLVMTADGRACLLTGLVLEALAAVWMRRIMRCDR